MNGTTTQTSGSSVPQKLREAKAKLILSQPFFASILLKLKFESLPKLGTMATDSVRLLYDEEFVESISVEHLKTILCHEVLHVALGHVFRRQGRDKMLWNIAADYAVNIVLKKSLFFSFPEDMLYDPSYDGFTTEAIYDKLYKRREELKKQVQSLIASGKFASNDVMDYDEQRKKAAANKDKAGGPQPRDYRQTLAEQEADWKINIAQAAQIAKMQGVLPSGIDRMVNSALEPRLPWEEVLARFVTERARDDYSWTRPSNRYVNMGIYLPVLDSLKLGTVGVMIDTSGSISQQEINVFASELRAILALSPSSKAEIVYVDADVQGHETLTEDDLSYMKPKGGGGTRFSPGFDFFEKNEEELENVVCYIYFTDGYCNEFPKSTPSRDTLWILLDENPSFKPPFGETLVMKNR